MVIFIFFLKQILLGGALVLFFKDLLSALVFRPAMFKSTD